MVLLKDLLEDANFSRRPKEHFRKPSGFRNVYRVHCEQCHQGFYWSYIDGDVLFSSVDFFTLKRRVEDMGLEWCKDNHYYALRTAKLLGFPLYDLL